MNKIAFSEIRNILSNLTIPPRFGEDPSVTGVGVEISKGIVVPVTVTRKLVRKGTRSGEAVQLEITCPKLLEPGDEIRVRVLDSLWRLASKPFCLYIGEIDKPNWGITDTVDPDAWTLPICLILEGFEAPPKPKPKAEKTEAVKAN